MYRNIPEEGDWSKFWAEEDRFVLEGLSPDNENRKMVHGDTFWNLQPVNTGRKNRFA